jgi:outer membrane immunogenic protein
MKRMLGGMVVAAALSGSALAADLGARSYDKAPAMAASVTNWSGLYIGGNVGYGRGSGDTSFLPQNLGALGTIAPATTLDTKLQGVTGGAQIGYNWQMGAIVTGLEADIQGFNIRGSVTQSPLNNLPTFFPSFRLADEKLAWFGTVRGRIGVTVAPDLLLYGTGGLAFGQIDASANTDLGFFPRDFYPASVSQTKVGWAAGAGAEWMFARNWSARAEYLRVDFGNVTAVGNVVTLDPDFVGTSVTYKWKTQTNIVRAGVNYHF